MGTFPGKTMTTETRPCRYCGRLIMLIPTEKGKTVPVDANSERVTLVQRNGFTVRGRIAVLDSERRAFAGYIPHHYTCPEIHRAKQDANK